MEVSSLGIVYRLLVAVRVILVLWPQPAGFTSDGMEFGGFSCRGKRGSIRARLACLPFGLARLAAGAKRPYGPSTLLVERAAALLLGLLLDRIMWRLARKWHLKPNYALCIHASSFLTFTALARPTDALLQSLLFASLLHHLVGCLDYAHPHGHECNAFRPHTEVRAGLVAGALLACGVQHRLSFACFALAPVLHWLTHKLSLSSAGLAVLAGKSFWSSAAFFLTSGCLNAVDAALRGSSASSVIQHLLSVDSLAPVRELSSAFDTRRLWKHPVRPFYYHAMLSVPLNFGPAGVLALLWAAQAFRPSRLGAISPAYWFYLSSWLVPLCLLSLYPDKDPASLVPLHIPLLFIATIRLAACCSSDLYRRRFNLLWLTFQSLSLFYWAFVHQSGHLTLFTRLYRASNAQNIGLKAHERQGNDVSFQDSSAYNAYSADSIVFVDLPKFPVPIKKVKQVVYSELVNNKNMTDDMIISAENNENKALFFVSGCSSKYCQFLSKRSLVSKFSLAVNPHLFDIDALRVLYGNISLDFQCLEKLSPVDKFDVFNSAFLFG